MSLLVLLSIGEARPRAKRALGPLGHVYLVERPVISRAVFTASRKAVQSPLRRALRALRALRAFLHLVAVPAGHNQLS